MAPGSKRAANGSSNGNGATAHANGFSSTPSGPPARRVRITVSRSGDRDADLDRIARLYSLILCSPGNDEVEIFVQGSGKMRSIPLPHRYVGHSERLEGEIRQLVGAESVAIIELRSQIESPPG
jgi:hypothetical protein